MARRACPTGKRQHRHRRAAAEQLRTIRTQRGEPLSVYRCQLCNDFHVGRERQALANPRKRYRPAVVHR